ncbi:MAG: transcription antitermination factor NusB [Candidatus Sumerlaeia bacterium]
MGIRRISREIALQLLYAQEATNDPLKTVIEAFQEAGFRKETGESGEVPDFSKALLGSSKANQDHIDGMIRSVLEHWQLERVSRIDRAILRLACAEMMFHDDIPPKVTINEYIEIAKRFGDKDSPSFVNGVLDAIARKMDKIPKP